MNKLNEKLAKLTVEYNTLNARYEEVVGEIEDLECEKTALEADLNSIEEEIESIKKQLLENTQDIKDPFESDFRKASRFASKDIGYSGVLENVIITNREIMACDGFKGIAIRSSNIPDKLKNTMIKWDVFYDFEKHTQKVTEENKLALKQLINETKESAKHVIKVSKNNFDDVFRPIYVKLPRYEILLLSYKGIYIGLQKDYISLLFRCMEDDDFDVYINSSDTAVVFEKPDTSIIILPVRMHESQVTNIIMRGEG